MGSRAGRADLDPWHYPPLQYGNVLVAADPALCDSITTAIYIHNWPIRTSIAPIPSHVAMSASSSAVAAGCQASFLRGSSFERQWCRGDDMEIACVNKHRWFGSTILSDGWCLDVVGMSECWWIACHRIQNRKVEKSKKLKKHVVFARRKASNKMVAFHLHGSVTRPDPA